MASNSTNNDHDLEAHRETWSIFVRLTIYSVIGISAVLIWMALFLT